VSGLREGRAIDWSGFLSSHERLGAFFERTEASSVVEGVARKVFGRSIGTLAVVFQLRGRLTFLWLAWPAAFSHSGEPTRKKQRNVTVLLLIEQWLEVQTHVALANLKLASHFIYSIHFIHFLFGG
jgi:hypothetical protein